MSRYIYITDDCLMDIAYEHMDDDALLGLQNALEEIPTVDVVEVVHGEWKECEIVQERLDEPIIDEWQSACCSVCGKYHTTPYMYYFDHFNYCPNCGARMDKKI